VNSSGITDTGVNNVVADVRKEFGYQISSLDNYFNQCLFRKSYKEG